MAIFIINNIFHYVCDSEMLTIHVIKQVLPNFTSYNRNHLTHLIIRIIFIAYLNVGFKEYF